MPVLSTYCKFTVLALMASGVLSACLGDTSRPHTIYVCLKDDPGVDLFLKELNSIAADEDMRISDGSRETKDGLDRIDPAGDVHQRNARMIHIDVLRRDGLGFSVTNMSLGPHEVVIGFLPGLDASELRDLSSRISARLQRRWRLQRLAQGTSASQIKGCGSGQKS